MEFNLNVTKEQFSLIQIHATCTDKMIICYIKLKDLIAPTNTRLQLKNNPVSLEYFHVPLLETQNQNETLNSMYPISIVINNMTAGCNGTENSCMIGFDENLTPVVTNVEKPSNPTENDLIIFTGIHMSSFFFPNPQYGYRMASFFFFFSPLAPNFKKSGCACSQGLLLFSPIFVSDV